ncbi:MAG: cell division protein FtsL [Succinivibrio sp.]
MQQSNAVRKIEQEFNYPAAQTTSVQAVKQNQQEADNKPRFGDRPNPNSRPVMGQNLTVVQRITQERIIRVKSPEDKFQEEIGENAVVPSLSLFEGYEKKQALIPAIIDDIFSNVLTYVMILLVTSLAVFKVHQVQITREMTVKYNEMNLHNELLHKEWLSLLSERESLTEYSVIRKSANENLQMVQPKTEDEVVIDLR